jgi:DNA processing protein
MCAWIAGGLDAVPRLAAARRAADQALAAATRSGLQTIAWGDPLYPPMLAAIPDAPAVLWLRGHAAALSRPQIAIVGARAASAYGLDTARRLASELVARGFAIVSGLARGIDGAAHRGALDGRGITVGVLGSGADIMYPPEHDQLGREIECAGAITSEFPPGTEPLPFHFPMRNRIISGLSRGIVVVEASERSGSLITAHAAIEQGREVMAVPGSVLNGRNGGGHALIKDGAALVERAEDVLDALGLWARSGGEEGAPDALLLDPVLEAMDVGESYEFDRLAESSGLDAAVLLPRLLDLELAGAVVRDASGRFVRSTGSC